MAPPSNPHLAALARALDRLLAQRVGAADFITGEARLLLVVVEPLFLVRLPDVGFVAPGIGIEGLYPPHATQHAVVVFDRLDPLRLDARIERMDTAGAEEHVGDLFLDLGPLLDLGRSHGRILAHPVIGIEQRLQVGHHELRIFVGEILAHHDAVEGRDLGFHAVEDLACESPVRQQLGEGHEVGMSVELALLQVGGAHFRALAGEVPEILFPAAVLHRLQQHAVGGGAERHRHLLALQVGQFVVGRILVDHHAVARAVQVVGDQRDQLALGLGAGLEGCAVHQQRIVAHHADLQLVRHHAVGHRRTGGEVLPVELEIDVLVFGRLLQFGDVLVQQAEFVDHDAAGHGVGGRVLRADADGHGFRLCGRTDQSTDECQCGPHLSGCFSSGGETARSFHVVPSFLLN